MQRRFFVKARRLFAPLLAIPLLLATACTATSDDVGESNGALNYRSTSGQEYLLSTEVEFSIDGRIQMLDAGAERDQEILAFAERQRTKIVNTIAAKLDEIWPEEVRTGSKNVSILLRHASPTLANLKSLGGAKYSMKVEAEFAAVTNIEQILRDQFKTAGAATYFPLSVDLANETVDLKILVTPVVRSLNSYPRYLALFEDGLDISVHIGDDHTDVPEERADLSHAKSLFTDMMISGFKVPVARFEDLAIDSPPFTKTIHVQGKDVEVRVRIFYLDMSAAHSRDILIDAYKDSMKKADVIIYDGHAARDPSRAGVVVSYHPRRLALAADDFKTVEGSDKQQVYLFNGCETYSTFADSLLQHPKRNPQNTDAVTLGNYGTLGSTASQVITFIHSFIDENPSGHWIPHSWDGILDRVNADGERNWVHVYGVHGIDDNPRISPLGDISKVGMTCTSNAECGAPDSKCLATSGSRSVCGVACADSVACPSGTQCLMPAGRTESDSRQCMAPSASP